MQVCTEYGVRILRTDMYVQYGYSCHRAAPKILSLVSEPSDSFKYAEIKFYKRSDLLLRSAIQNLRADRNFFQSYFVVQHRAIFWVCLYPFKYKCNTIHVLYVLHRRYWNNFRKYA